MPLLPTDIKLYVVGSQPDDRLVGLAAKNSRVVVTGFIDDPYPDIRGSIAMICPIRMGGGIQNKVIESLAVGAVTLISQLASKAFDDIPSSGMLVCEEPRSWADAILNARKNRSSSLAVAKAGRDYARERFSWEAFGRIIGDQIDQGIKMHLSQAEKQA
jgi:glycosyltransferase involved in cell wall biosynthesis